MDTFVSPQGAYRAPIDHPELIVGVYDVFYVYRRLDSMRRLESEPKCT